MAYTMERHSHSVSAEARLIAVSRGRVLSNQRAADAREREQDRASWVNRDAAVANAWRNGLRAAQNHINATIDVALHRQYDTSGRITTAPWAGAAAASAPGIDGVTTPR